jgi:hypothetical protein
LTERLLIGRAGNAAFLSYAPASSELPINRVAGALAPDRGIRFGVGDGHALILARVAKATAEFAGIGIPGRFWLAYRPTGLRRILGKA